MARIRSRVNDRTHYRPLILEKLENQLRMVSKVSNNNNNEMSSDTQETHITLSIGNVSFRLVPDEQTNSKFLSMERSQNTDAEECSIKLENFSGTLRIIRPHCLGNKSKNEITPSPPESPRKREVPLVEDGKEDSKEEEEQMSVVEEFRKADMTQPAVAVTPSSKKQKRSHSQTEVEDGSSMSNKKLSLSQRSRPSTPTLGQMSQPCSSQQSELSTPCAKFTVSVIEDNSPEKPSPKVMGIVNLPSDDESDGPQCNASQPQNPIAYYSSEDEDESDDLPCTSQPLLSETQIEVKPEVNESSSPAPSLALTAPPMERWGHTLTPISSTKLILYAGQKDESSITSLQVYDMETESWSCPTASSSLPRVWHTSTYLPSKKLLFCFGGEDPDTAKVVEPIMVLDTEIMLWYPPTMSGKVPSARSGHTASLLPSQDLVIFGGISTRNKWLNTVSVLDTNRWIWKSARPKGTPPPPRSYHTATVVNDKIVIIGGNNDVESFNSVHILQDMTWSHPQIKVKNGGDPPSPRTGHACVLVGKKIMMFGGWDPDTCDEQIFGDCWTLCTETWMWEEVGRVKKGRVGQEMCSLEVDEGRKVVVFGGRVGADDVVGDLEVLHLPKEW